jgi:hypothetical protein
VFCGRVQPIIRLDIGRYSLPWRHAKAPYVRPPRSPTSTRLLLPSTSRPSSASLVARRCTTRTSPLSFQPGTPMKAAVPRGAIRLRTTPASTPSSNACRPGEGRPGIHTLGVGPFFGCARIPAAQKAMPAATWPATGHSPSTLPLARTPADG